MERRNDLNTFQKYYGSFVGGPVIAVVRRQEECGNQPRLQFQRVNALN